MKTERGEPASDASDQEHCQPTLTDTPRKKRLWRWLRWTCRIAAIAIVLVVLLVLFWLRGALYNRLVRFPRQEAAWQNVRAQRQPVQDVDREFRGILHAHSHHSHDSEMPFEEILEALKAARLDFICLSDHCVDGRADFDLQWRGLHDGKLFIPGFEMKNGFMPFGVSSGVVLSNSTEPALLARQIAEHGGLLFYAHPEEPRDWERPELVGMEIYNIHSDFKRTRGLPALLPDLLVNQRRYPEQILRTLFHRPDEFLSRWDGLNQTRHITGIAGNDCHQNVGFRGFYTAADTLRIEDTSPETLKELKLNWFTRPLARVLCGPLKPERKLFHFQLDPYERMARYVNTHVLAPELSEPAIKEALRAGRVFVGFDMLADASGFRWFATDGNTRAVMGESAPLSAQTRLHALSPLPCRLTIVKNGKTVHQQQGRELEWTPGGPGKYRVEAELKILDQWVPWVYANPIELR